eukprot:8289044-Alexandrium_andersonii.AAC.1
MGGRVPVRPPGQTSLSAARNLHKNRATIYRGGLLRRRASRGASGARVCNMGGSDVCRFRAA